MATAIKTENDGSQWYELHGTDIGTGIEFDGDVYGSTDDDRVLDEDGAPLTEGDRQTIAVRNTIGA